MTLLPCLPLLCCLGLLRGEPQGPQGFPVPVLKSLLFGFPKSREFVASARREIQESPSSTLELPSGSHSLRYSFSFLSEPLPGVPQYSVVGYVDDVPIIGYTSESGRAGPRAPWMEKITIKEPHFWEESRETFEDVKKTLNDSLRNQMEQKNQPPGLHVFQMMLGCELCEDGSPQWFERFAYDGQNFAVTTDSGASTQDSEELMNCKELLKKLLKYGEESLRRRVAPQTRVSQRKANNRTFLVGYAYGFYPGDIEVKWVRDGVEIPWESNELLPNPDGTYQVRTTVEVQEGDDVMTYEYHVNHSSLLEPITVTYGAQRRGLQRGALVAVAMLVPVVLVAVLVLLALVLKAKLHCQTPAPGGSNEEGQEMMSQNRQADTAGSGTGSDLGSST